MTSWDLDCLLSLNPKSPLDRTLNPRSENLRARPQFVDKPEVSLGAEAAPRSKVHAESAHVAEQKRPHSRTGCPAEVKYATDV